MAPTPAAAATPATPAPSAPLPPDDRKIELGLAAVLRGIPSEALAVEPWTIADDIRISLPFANVEKQLSSGRVSIAHDAFLQALPENHRHVLAPESGLTEIQLPLPEIFQNLPASALAIRPDQVIEETGTLYPTPFSQKADEDAHRFGVSATPASQAEPEPASEVIPQMAMAAEPVPDEHPAEPPAAPAVGEAGIASLIDHPLPTADAPKPAMETVTPLEPARDVPLDLGEAAPVAPVLPEPSAVAKDDAAAVTAAETPATVKDLPSETVVEPPAAVEPSPLEEALAVLESTAPGQTPKESSERASAISGPTAQPASTVVPAEPIPEAVATPAASAAPAAPSAKPPVLGSVKSRDSELQTLFMTEDEIDAKTVVRLVSQFPGVSGCAVMFADGLRLAGNFPDGDAEGFSAMAPPFYKRTQNFVAELKLGGLKAFTVYTENDLLSFFMHDDICVSVRHSGRGFLPGVREKLEIVTREMARLYSNAKPAADSSL